MRATVTDSPGRKQFLLRLPHSLFEEARSCADKDGISITAYMNEAIAAYTDATDRSLKAGATPTDTKSYAAQADVKWYM